MTSARRPEVIALIPARGGSKSIPRKNLLRIAGRPLIAHSIAHALGSRHITRTIVSTEDAEIAEVAAACGAEVPFIRPAEFARDESPDIDVFRHALGWLRDHDTICDLVVHLRPTGPVRRTALIDAAIERMLAHPEADSLRSVSRPLESPFKMWRIADGYLEPLVAVAGIPEPHSAPRQQLPEVFWQNGYVDVIRPAVVMEGGSMCGRVILPFVVDEPIFEIDYPDSIAAAEAALTGIAQGIWPAADRAAGRHPV